MNSDIVFIDFNDAYAEPAVAMWRRSKEAVLGIKEGHTFSDHVDFLSNVLARENRVILAIDSHNNTVAGLLATDGLWINQLYVHTHYQRKGIGTSFIEKARELSSGMLKLYTFEKNLGAQRFYEKQGFRIVGRGCDNEEQLPDLLYEWQLPA